MTHANGKRILRRKPCESPRGFITAPTLDQLRPTSEEQAKLRLLWEWLEASKKSFYVWK
jgi:hypothetical protein